MPVKETDGSTPPKFEAFDGGFTWVANPNEEMQRASHALEADEGVWLVDPVDTQGLEERIGDLGTVTGVVLLLNRHERDATRIARRHDVPITRPPGIDRELDVATIDVTGGLPETSYEFLDVLNWPGWHERALWDGETLVVPESLGTNDYALAGGERLGLNPVARLDPPKHLAKFNPDRILVGHGLPLLEDVTPALEDAVRNARRRLPKAWLGALKALL